MTGIRGDLVMLGALARQPGWLSKLPDEKRELIVRRLTGLLADEKTSPRVLVSAARVLIAFERSDIERAKLSLSMEVEDDGDDDEAAP